MEIIIVEDISWGGLILYIYNIKEFSVNKYYVFVCSKYVFYDSC